MQARGKQQVRTGTGSAALPALALSLPPADWDCAPEPPRLASDFALLPDTAFRANSFSRSALSIATSSPATFSQKVPEILLSEPTRTRSDSSVAAPSSVHTLKLVPVHAFERHGRPNNWLRWQERDCRRFVTEARCVGDEHGRRIGRSADRPALFGDLSGDGVEERLLGGRGGHGEGLRLLFRGLVTGTHTRAIALSGQQQA